jgi:hypothetical protein
MIGAYATVTGKLITVLASAAARSIGDGNLLPDPSGRHLLVVGFSNTNTAVLDIAKHRLSVLHVPLSQPAAWRRLVTCMDIRGNLLVLADQTSARFPGGGELRGRS